jgi:hypothetical protein
MAVSATVAIAATMSVSAFAIDATLSTGKDEVTVSGYTVEADQYTVMVFKGETINSDSIYYINQGSDLGTLLNGMKVKASTLEDGTTTNELQPGTYTVRVGNDAGAAVAECTFVVEEVADTPTTFKITGYVADTYATVTLGETTVNVGADGSFTFADLANGVYDIIVKAPGALNRTLNATVADADVSVASADAPIALKYGLIREDATKVEIDDLNVLLNAFGKESSDAAYKLACDFDRNGKVEIDDLNRLLNNFGKTVEQVYTAE